MKKLLLKLAIIATIPYMLMVCVWEYFFPNEDNEDNWGI